MARPKKQKLPQLTEAEWTLMKVVWENEPCPSGTVRDSLEKSKNWAYSTVKTTMDRMVDKGLLKIKKIRNLQLFSSAITEKQARKGELNNMLKRAFDGALTPMMQFLVENENLSKTELDDLRKLLDKKQNKKQ